MLLSSVLPHPHLQSLQIPPLSPFNFTATQEPPASPALTALQSTCRELQALIASAHHRPQLRPQRSSSTRAPNALQSPIELLAPDGLSVSKGEGRGRIKKTQYTRRMKEKEKEPATLLRNAKKPLHVAMPSQLNQQPSIGNSKLTHTEAPMTPMGQCGEIPLDVPRGLERKDFEKLEQRVYSRTMPLKEGGLVEGSSRKTELNKYDEAMVGLLLKQLRLQAMGERGR
ncbi:MAG: hypothetical protein Q9209_003015 [Squamulea sp. 1 TL-2023]